MDVLAPISLKFRYTAIPVACGNGLPGNILLFLRILVNARQLHILTRSMGLQDMHDGIVPVP